MCRAPRSPPLHVCCLYSTVAGASLEHGGRRPRHTLSLRLFEKSESRGSVRVGRAASEATKSKADLTEDLIFSFFSLNMTPTVWAGDAE